MESLFRTLCPSRPSWLNHSQPIPAEHAFAADRQTVAIGLDPLEKVSEVVVFNVGVEQLFALAIHDADVHLPGMEIDSAIELSGRGVVFHGCVVVVSQDTGESNRG